MLDYLRRGGNDNFYREIVHEKITNSWGSNISGKDERNYILQKAIDLYIGEMKNIEYKEAKIALAAVQEKAKRDENTWELVFHFLFFLIHSLLHS